MGGPSKIKPCIIDGCERMTLKTGTAKGLCRYHYRRLRQYGNPLESNQSWKTVDWLKAHLNYSDSACLLWPFGRNKKGYPNQIWMDGIKEAAHRIMCRLANGPPPTPEHEAAHLCHCGISGCVHPGHLLWQTPEQNRSGVA